MNDTVSVQPQAGAKHDEMKPRLLKGMQADYESAVWEGDNTSGMLPVGKNVLVRMDECAKATAGGVLLVDDMTERMDMASVTGVLFAVGDDAFKDHRGNAIGAVEPGERVWTEKYAGHVGRGADGKLYRIMDYSNIMARADPRSIGEAEQPHSFGL